MPQEGSIGTRMVLRKDAPRLLAFGEARGSIPHLGDNHEQRTCRNFTETHIKHSIYSIAVSLNNTTTATTNTNVENDL